jgi:hypothetical protein
VLAAAQLVVLAVEQPALHALSIWTSGLALWLVVINASIRVYQSAWAFPEQRERYETKWLGLVTLKARFAAATSVEQRVSLIREIEQLEINELRDFLRQMRRSSYLL